jgi:C4-type Zn-finger protein
MLLSIYTCNDGEKQMRIDIVKRSELEKECTICGRQIGVRWYDMDIEYREDGIQVTAKRNLCQDCHFGLEEHFTGHRLL